MSAGSFVVSTYEADSGKIHLIRLQNETVNATFAGTDNDPPAAAVDSQFAAEVNRGARAYGLRPRRVNVAFTDAPPTGYRPYTTVSIPVLTKAVYDDIELGGLVSYSGGTGKAKSKTGESTNPGASAIGTIAAVAPADGPEAP